MDEYTKNHKPNKCSENCGRYAVYFKDPTSGRSSIVGYCRDCYEVLCARSLREESLYTTPHNFQNLSGTRLYGTRATKPRRIKAINLD
jgi:hypothetical protein